VSTLDQTLDWSNRGSDEPPLVRGTDRKDDFDMDITPMIDITFLLLIFFVVCSTLDKQTPIELAQAKHGKGVGERDCIIITIGNGGVDAAPVFLADSADGDPLPEDFEEQRSLIEAAVQKAKTDERKEDVLIKADRNVAHRDVARVIKAVSRVEGMKIHLAVLESQ
jgi:biopolymer transport protein ExbD